MEIDELIDVVVATTELHVEASADPEFHRRDDHMNNIIIPHLEAVDEILKMDGGRNRLATRIAELGERNEQAALSLSLVVQNLVKGGIDKCIRQCRGLVDETLTVE